MASQARSTPAIEAAYGSIKDMLFRWRHLMREFEGRGLPVGPFFDHIQRH
jgi:hypothetical protein